MRFGVLGPVEVWTPDQALPLERPLRRAVLAYLLLHAGQVVSVDQLADSLWGGAAPATARAQIQTAISRIRRVLRDAGVAEQLATRSAGYLLHVADGQLDLDVFEDRVAGAREAATAGRPADAAEAYRRALLLWRGPALGGAAAVFVDAARARLEDRRLAAREDLTDCELALGRHADLVAELGALVDAHPLRERLTGQLMLALYRGGRQAEALAAYHQLRLRLGEQLGIDPGREVRELHEAVLRADPALELGRRGDHDPTPRARPAPGRDPVVPRQLPAAMRHFAGRTAELEVLNGLVDQAAGPGGTVVISAIDGTAGIGKTAMAVHWAHRVAERFPDGQLYVNLRGFDPTGSMLTPFEAVRGFLDAFAVPAEQIPFSLEAQAALYRSLVAGRRVLVVLDNARDADHVRALLPGSPGCLVVVTSRNWLSTLVVAEGAHPITLDLLSVAEARELLARRIGPERVDAERAAVDEILDRCARLPLALSIVAARAAAKPGFPLGALAGELRAARGRLDAFDGGDPAVDVRSVLSWSYEQLKAEAATMFRLLALHPGPDISTAAAASLAGVRPDLAHALLAELARAHLVAEHAPGRFAFHDLLRAYADELCQAFDGEPERRAALRRMLDHYVHSAYAATLRLDPHRDPVTFAPAGPGVIPETCAGPDEAIGWFTTEHPVLLGAIRATDGEFPSHTGPLAWAMADYLGRSGHWNDWVTTQAAAVDAARRLGDRAEQARAHRGLASAYARRSRFADAEAQLGQALALFRGLGDHSGQGHTYLGFSWIYGRQGRHNEALVHAEHALDQYHAAGQPAGQAKALNTVGWYHALLGDHRAALVCCQRALELQQALGDRVGEANTWDSLGYIHHELGDYRAAITCYQRAIDQFREASDPYYEADTLTHLGETHVAAGDLDAARATWQRALDILTELSHPDADDVLAKLRGSEALAGG